MQKILTTAEMREVDRLSTERHGIPSLTLMENAALAAAAVIENELGRSVSGKSILIFCGRGNNGGDGAALAHILSEKNARVYAVLLGKVADTAGDANHNFSILSVYNDNLEAVDEKRRLVFYACDNAADLSSVILARYGERETCDVIVDAVLGTGVTRPLAGLYLEAVNLINQLREGKRCSMLISLDLPSGLVADSARLPDLAVRADITVTFTAPKLANVFPTACRAGGKLVVAGIGSPQKLIDDSESKTYMAGRIDAAKYLTNTSLEAGSYKGKRGHVLVAAGSRNYSGAAVLAANAAVRSGAGLVTGAVPESVQISFSERVRPEAMSLPLPETASGAISADAADKFIEFSSKVTVAAVGCGLSSNETSTREFVRQIVANRKIPMILDADGLNALSPFNISGSEDLPLILTPHIGEFARLLGIDKIEDSADVITLARGFAVKHNVILVLKGERSLVAEPGGRVTINPTGNAGVGKGGNGDTLTGIIAGFLAQAWAGIGKNDSPAAKMDMTFKAVIAALYIAGMAADAAAAKFGMRAMTASDVSECLSEVIIELERDGQQYN